MFFIMLSPLLDKSIKFAYVVVDAFQKIKAKDKFSSINVALCSQDLNVYTAECLLGNVFNYRLPMAQQSSSSETRQKDLISSSACHQLLVQKEQKEQKDDFSSVMAWYI